jgi:hypothetical protein
MASWFDKKNADEMLARPAYDSKFNPHNYDSRNQMRFLLAVLFFRELPIKNFYVRSTVVYFFGIWYCLRFLAKGYYTGRPIVFMNHPLYSRATLNYPDLFWWTHSKILPKVPMTPSANKEWKMRQQPVFHQYHRCVYRYKNRSPRYLPWDGTMNQPVMPYLHDTGSDVINGTWKRNTNTSPQLF